MIDLRLPYSLFLFPSAKWYVPVRSILTASVLLGDASVAPDASDARWMRGLGEDALAMHQSIVSTGNGNLPDQMGL